MKDRIYQIMKQQGMTQKEFAGELCIAEGTLSSIYTGRTRPTNNIVSAIHERFPQINILWLMFGEGDMMAAQATVSNAGTDTAGPAAQQTPQDLFSGAVLQAPQQPLLHETVKYVDKPQRKITEIRVFYDDGTFETFNA